MREMPDRMPSRTSRSLGARTWLGVWTIGIAVFALVTSELFPVGVLSAISADLERLDGRRRPDGDGPGLVAAVSAPLVAVYARDFDSRVVLSLLVALVALSNLASAVRSEHRDRARCSRAVGIGVGGFWALAAGIAPRLVPQARVPLATAVVFGGVSAASVIGVPATAQLEQRARLASRLGDDRRRAQRSSPWPSLLPGPVAAGASQAGDDQGLREPLDGSTPKLAGAPRDHARDRRAVLRVHLRQPDPASPCPESPSPTCRGCCSPTVSPA